MFSPNSSIKKQKILHIATGNYSPRVIKEVSTLTEYYEVYVIQAVALDDSEPKAKLHQLIYYPQLWKRVFFNFPIILYFYFTIRPKIVHLHVAELLPLGLLFSIFNSKIIFDVYEDFHKKLPVKGNHLFVKYLFIYFNNLACEKFYLIFAENGYLTSYPTLLKTYSVILNYPKNLEFEDIHFNFDCQNPEVFYIGQISSQRSILEVILAIDLLKKDYPSIKLHLFGYFSTCGFPKQLSEQIKECNLEENILIYGMTSFRKAAQIAKNSIVGLALLKDIGDYKISYPTKMFEYMASGLPVITSNFEHCLSVINSSKAGFGINPEDSKELSKKINWLIQNPKKAIEMGKSGREAVRELYNWSSEAEKLITFYDKVLAD